jgi:hypothetical protein
MTDPEHPFHEEPSTDFVFPADWGNILDKVFLIYLGFDPPRQYRRAAQRSLKVIHAIDEIMSRSPEHWEEIAQALGLPSTGQVSDRQVTEQSINRFISLAELAHKHQALKWPN